MNVRTPTLRQLPDGRWMTKWGNKKRYFGRDAAEARKAYAKSLTDWAAWRANVAHAQAAPPHGSALVEHIARDFIASKGRERGPRLVRYYQNHLGRFVSYHGKAVASDIRVIHVQRVKDQMLLKDFKPKTINHDIVAIKVMFRWAEEQELIPAISLRGCRTLPLGPPPDKSLTIDQVRAMIEAATPAITPWLTINYLCGMRPSEVVRVIHGQGDWVEPGIFRLDRGKTDLTVSLKRHVVFSPLAFSVWKQCRPQWCSQEAYAGATARCCGPGGPGRLRHSAATHLRRLGTAPADIALFLGHVPSRVLTIYSQPAWQLLREVAAQLSL